MKKTLLLVLVMVLSSLSTMAMSRSKVRNHARYLTDRMAYELDLNPMQYDDCYEINYDFIYIAADLMDDVVYGYYDAIDLYYRYLDYRNEDLRHIMTSSQYIRFLTRDYFYRPIYSNGSSWGFRIYTIYSNRSFFYFDAPTVYKDYRGGHSRSHYSNGFYADRYKNNNRYTGDGRISGSQNFTTHRKSDFGTNLRERNQKPDYNNYNNRNSQNRTSDPRYRDNSGNQNSPQINNRNQSGEHRGSSNQSNQTRPSQPSQQTKGGTPTTSRTGQGAGTRGRK